MSDTEYRAYLLGRLPAADAERLEERLLEDDELFETLRGVEDDLFDELARGRLNASDRERFLARSGARADRAAFARALAERTPIRARVLRFPVHSTAWLAAAAALVLVVGGLWWIQERGPAGGGSTAPQTAAVTAPPITVALTLTLGSARAAGAATDVSVPVAATVLQLRVRLNPADRYDRYVLELRSSTDAVVWRADDVHASAEAGDLTLAANVPASVLASGAYELAVRGGSEDLGFVALKVTRTP